MFGKVDVIAKLPDRSRNEWMSAVEEVIII